jgi:hypothetical protein
VFACELAEEMGVVGAKNQNEAATQSGDNCQVDDDVRLERVHHGY